MKHKKLPEKLVRQENGRSEFGANVIADIERQQKKDPQEGEANKLKRRRKQITLDEILEGTSNTDKRRLLEIATDVQTGITNMKKDSFNIGKLLHTAKQILPHGKFTLWIKYYFKDDLPYSTAYFYMKIYETFQDDPSSVKNIPTKFLQMVTQKEFPEEALKLIKEQAHSNKINNNDLKQVNEIYELFKTGQIGQSQFVVLAKDQIKLGIEMWKNPSTHRINTNMRESLYRGGGDILKRIRDLIETARSMNGLYPYDPKSKEHAKLMKYIDEIIVELENLKIELEGGKGFFKQISTREDGAKFVDGNL